MRKSIYLRLLLVSIFYFEFNINEVSAQIDISSGDTVLVVAGKEYKANVIGRILLGAHYRKEWTTPVKVKIFDIHKAAGGLKPIKKGGSMQTINLRLKDSLGREYVLRSVNKQPVNALPEDLKKTKVVAYIFQDQTSSEHPYGLAVVPYLSKAAGVFYTNPQLVYIPFDSDLGEFKILFGGMLMYFEERPDGDMSHLASSGNSSHVIGTEKMFEEIYADHDNQVDERLFLKTRLFDMLIGDWGRHEDQWRWATYDYGDTRLYKPIPRDRDHVFFRSDGVIPYIASRKWAFRKNQNFDYNFKDVIGLNLSAASLDRTLLTALSKREWIEAADSLKNSLSDSVIENAIRTMPENIFSIHGEEIIKKLKIRRDELTEVAEKYYLALSREVNVNGSDKDEIFIVNRLNNLETAITMTKKKSHDTLYHRIFYTKETKDIRLFGLGGEDLFFVYGKAGKGPKVRMIGGDGMDRFIDSSSVMGGVKKNFVYDFKEGNEAILSKDTKDMRSNNPMDSVNAYSRTGHHYNLTGLTPTYEYNPDDGLFLGLGIARKTYVFRKYPYASLQRFWVNYAFQTSAITFNYFGDFKSIIKNWNLSLDARTFGPKFVFNYFGFGNETVQERSDINFYRVRARAAVFTPTLYKNVNKNFEVGFGLEYQYIEIQNTSGRFISTTEARVDSSAFTINHYLGVKVYSEYSTVKNILFPLNGIRWNIEGEGYEGFSSPQQFVRVSSDFAAFYTPKLPLKITFASRIGGATNFGDFQFFQGNTLGGTTNLRGYRRSRFYGRSSFYQNLEMRIKMLDLNFYVFPGKVGLILFFDYGRVWADGEKSNLLHTGYGPGFWIQIHNRANFTTTYGISPDRGFLNVKFHFLF